MKIILIIILSLGTLFAQVKDIFEYGGYITEKIAQMEYEFTQQNPWTFVDSVFSMALTLADSNKSDALLFSAIALMPYVDFYVTLPIMPSKLKLKFFNSINKDKFMQKMKNLPSKIFDDSPDTEFGDKDKWVHFFITAFLSYNFGENFADYFGLFVENFEEEFKVDGKVDLRDISINRAGAEFGKALSCEFVNPSIILVKQKNLRYGKNLDN